MSYPIATRRNLAVREAIIQGSAFAFKSLLVLIFLAAHFFIFKFYLTSYNEVNDKLLVATQQVAVCEKEKNELKEKMNHALVPETSLGELAKNRIVDPVSNAAKSAYNSIKGLVSSEEKPVPAAKPSENVLKEQLKGFYNEITKATL